MRLHAVRRVARPRRPPHELFRQLRAVSNAPALATTESPHSVGRSWGASPTWVANACARA